MSSLHKIVFLCFVAMAAAQNNSTATEAATPAASNSTGTPDAADAGAAASTNGSSVAAPPNWEDKVEELSETVNMLAAWIVSSNGTILATSNDPLFELEDPEAVHIAKVFSGKFPYEASVNVGGINYRVYTVGTNTLYGKRDWWGLVLEKTKQTILVSSFRAWDAGDALQNVRSFANHLIAEGY